MIRKLEEDLKQIRNKFGSDVIFTLGCNNAGPFIIKAERIPAPVPFEGISQEDNEESYIG
ncbi:MAG: hypothetical protein A3D34_01400 [Candidatus Staskawiczbacteria bacterium RIFCSPHIGHO2_02_FULL_33_16]|uniref:Uncharacterized protein n=1 Tax=Candidatus Staskawiczbacteria bacterium RIFCSPHIGHO2_02_FULL_33_16 TaxID=1802204 RepID=A0A1G2HUR3_9BACT|nr:MAG: hypothetical protein A3D34_01400 [Candidatus Staskawiczbacteria bacterium RIFCSPHIGHO2_02_FULL_33_16]